MALTKRQASLLNRIIKDYIRLAEPVSSDFLKKKHNLELSSATIRAEMQKLTDAGYLNQPHTSAGRIPTDRGYRFFVDFLTKKREKREIDQKIIEEIKKVKKEIRDFLSFQREFNKLLSLFSSGLAISYFFETETLFKEGWIKMLNHPEFSNPDYIKDFFLTVDAFEKNIENFETLENSQIEIFIGEEIPIIKSSNFSIIVSKHSLAGKEGLFAILGPKRMAYAKNICLIESVIKTFENYE